MNKRYVPQWGIDVSLLGFGAMRLPTCETDGRQGIDRAEAVKMIRTGIDAGINYVDTAFGYHGGESEIVVGQALRDGYRERVYLATKCPSWLVKEEGDMYRFLDTQLEKLQTDHIDFYLLHGIGKARLDDYRRFNYQKFLQAALDEGKIRRACFSFHDDAQAFIEILNDYDWSMAQVQFNYLDDESQATLAGIREAGKRGVGVIAMEPLRGGALANPPKGIGDMIEAHPSRRSAVEWAFAYTAAFPEIKVILSGMSNMEQLTENLRIFENLPAELTDGDMRFLKELKDAYNSRVKTGCTACGYCQPCPQGVLIPEILTAYDDAYRLLTLNHFRFAYNSWKERNAFADMCVECGECEGVCPQKIPIMRHLADAARQLHAGEIAE